MKDPLLSIIIPTYGRSNYLERAIDSALLASLNDDVEIIVVPNGPSEEWKNVAQRYDQSNVKFYPIDQASVCAARNKGLEKSTGKYVRFLDDDDYLYENGAQIQLKKIIQDNSDVCSGMVEICDEQTSFGFCTFPDEADFISANVQTSGLRLPISNIYLKEKIKHLWDEAYSRAEDYVFILDLCIAQEVTWSKVDIAIGCWFQHGKERLSLNSKEWSQTKIIETWAVERLFKLYRVLKNNKRLTTEREKFISKQMWTFIGENYDKDKVYCLKFISLLKQENVNYFNCYGLRSGIARNRVVISLAKNFPIIFFMLKRIYRKLNREAQQSNDIPDYVRIL